MITILTHDLALFDEAAHLLRVRHEVLRARSWTRLRYLVRERPVTAIVLDGDGLPKDLEVTGAVGELRQKFPSLGLVLIAGPATDPVSLFHLGRAGIDGLVMVGLDDIAASVEEHVARSLRGSAEAVVTRTLSAYLAPREMEAVRVALRSVARGWSTERFADAVGFSRAHLSLLLREQALPSAGHLLGWARLLHGGHWLSDPGRTADSVSRQLDYSSGAAFRRALRNYVGATPTEVRERGGLQLVMGRFLAQCEFGLRTDTDRSVA